MFDGNSGSRASLAEVLIVVLVFNYAAVTRSCCVCVCGSTCGCACVRRRQAYIHLFLDCVDGVGQSGLGGALGGRFSSEHPFVCEESPSLINQAGEKAFETLVCGASRARQDINYTHTHTYINQVHIHATASRMAYHHLLFNFVFQYFGLLKCSNISVNFLYSLLLDSSFKVLRADCDECLWWPSFQWG